MTKQQLIEMYYKKRMTLQQIGDVFGVTRERVRQVMEKNGLPRLTRRSGPAPWDKTLDEYFARISKNGGSEDRRILKRLAMKDRCEKCGGQRNLHIHHKVYPATSKESIQTLCSSCHGTTHWDKYTLERDLAICKDYLNGQTPKILSKKYSVKYPNIYYILHRWNVGVSTGLKRKLKRNFYTRARKLTNPWAHIPITEVTK